MLARRIRKALSRAKLGERLEFVCADPLASIDIPHLVATLGDHLVAQVENGGPDFVRLFVGRRDRRSRLRSQGAMNSPAHRAEEQVDVPVGNFTAEPEDLHVSDPRHRRVEGQLNHSAHLPAGNR